MGKNNPSWRNKTSIKAKRGRPADWKVIPVKKLNAKSGNPHAKALIIITAFETTSSLSINNATKFCPKLKKVKAINPPTTDDIPKATKKPFLRRSK